MQFGIFGNLSMNTSVPTKGTGAGEGAALEGVTNTVQPNMDMAPLALEGVAHKNEFANLVQVEQLIAKAHELPVNEQGSLLKQLVVELPKESIHQVTNLVQENFGEVLEAFPKLQEPLLKGDVKGFVDQLNVLTASEGDLLAESELQSLKLLNQQSLNNNQGQANKNTAMLSQKMTIPTASEVLPEQVNQADDFLSMRNMGKQSSHQLNKNITQQKGAFQANQNAESFFSHSQNPVENSNVNNFLDKTQMAQMKPKSQLAEYGKMSDQFTDNFFKTNAMGESTANTIDSANGNQVSLSSVILGATGSESMAGQQGDGAELGNSQATQVLDLSSISAKNSNQLINKISNYIQQNAIMNETEVELVVKHDDLGMFKVNVQKISGDQKLDIAIEAMTKDGHQFFADNEVELIKNLNNNGIKLSSLKVSQVADGKISTFSDNSRNMSDNNSQGNSSQSQGQQQGFTKNQNSNSGQERRQELWNMYREQANYAA